MLDSVYCGLSHAREAVVRGEADPCVRCKQYGKTPGFPTCSKLCGGLLAFEKRSSGTNNTSYQPRPYSNSYSSSYSTPSTTTAPKVPNRPSGGKQSITYPCGCIVMTQVAYPPVDCPICQSSGTGNSWTPAAQNPTSYRDADPFQDQAETALAQVDPRHQTAGGFRPPTQPRQQSDQPRATNRPKPRKVDILGESEDEEAYKTPNEVALPESPVVETTSGSDSAVLVNYSGASRSNTMESVPPPYEDAEWTEIDPPSGRSSPAKDATMLSPKSQKKLPDLPPRRKGLLGRTMTSSKAAAGSEAASQEPATSTPLWRRSRPESPVKITGALGRPQNSKHSAPSQPDMVDQAQVPAFPLFPSAPTNALGISENPDEPQKPLIVTDPKVNGASEVLSNQDPLPIEYKKKKYPSGEHLYHAMKFIDSRPLLAEHIRECADPKGEAARFFFERNPGWDQMRVQKMEEVIQLKCKQHSAFKDKLRDSGDTQIYFDDPDPFWGTGPDGRGENKFGEVLMTVRATLGKGRLTKRF